MATGGMSLDNAKSVTYLSMGRPDLTIRRVCYAKGEASIQDLNTYVTNGRSWYPMSDYHCALIIWFLELVEKDSLIADNVVYVMIQNTDDSQWKIRIFRVTHEDLVEFENFFASKATAIYDATGPGALQQTDNIPDDGKDESSRHSTLQQIYNILRDDNT